METMLYTIDHINAVARILPKGVSLGAHVLDDCDTDTYGLEQAVDFIKGRNEGTGRKVEFRQTDSQPAILQCVRT